MKQLRLTGLQLKIIALVGMIIDHINTYFGYQLGFPDWIGWVGRFVAPVFLYLLMEGFIYTSNRSKYFRRLYTGAFVMFLINFAKNIVTKHYYHPVTKEFDGFMLIEGNNIFLTLMCFFIIFCLVERFQKNERNKWKYLVLLLPMVMVTCFTEGGLYLLPLGLVLAYFGSSKNATIWTLTTTSLLLAIKAVINYYSFGVTYSNLYHYLAFDNQFMQWLAVPLILAYNGERGGKGKRWEKDLFYVMYPMHLIVIYVIKIIIQ